ncbi:MAG: hypothetical protein KY476_16350, partial [Planctomycetes bacterium]|nr:hypothetical protein [Planctomycetota bacterium]
ALRHLPDLRIMGLEETEITDKGLQSLGQLGSLQSLDLDGCTGITDTGVGHLTALTVLEKLEMGATQVTGVGLAGFAQSKNLEWLRLDGSKVDDKGLAVISTLKSLRTLCLADLELS